MDEQLKKLINLMGISQKDFAESIGISPSAISEVIKGRVQSFNNETMLKIKETYNVNLHWLLTGKGEMFVDDLSPNPFPTREGEGEWQ